MDVIPNLIVGLCILIPSLIGLLLVYLHNRAEQKEHDESIALQKKQLDLNREELEHRHKLFESESLRISSAAYRIGEQVAKSLKEDTRWAVESLEKAKLGVHAQSIFGDRWEHFREEKKFLAERFAPLLLRRCKRLVESGKKVHLIIDSGTTLYPFFEKLGSSLLGYYENRDAWIDRIVISSNNLPGVERLTETGRINPNNRFSPLVVQCKLLPGDVLPVYAAITGEETNVALKCLRDKAGKATETVFIGLIVGNWVRLRRTDPVCPVPLARGQGHLEFKQALIDISDEVYVVSPLGKVFLGVGPEELNSVFRFNKEFTDDAQRPYDEVKISTKSPFVKLVSTSRRSGKILSEHSAGLNALIGTKMSDPQHFVNADCDRIPHIVFPFDRLPDDWFEQIETEFPHDYTRDEDFMSRFFSVPQHHH